MILSPEKCLAVYDLFIKHDFWKSHLLNLIFWRGKIRMLLQATVELDEGFSLFAHFKKHIPFTKETLQNTEFKQIITGNTV